MTPVVDWTDWNVVATSVTGRAHVEACRESQDTFRTNLRSLVDPRSRRSDRPFVAVVSDGLGSTVEGATGASLSASSVFAAACEAFSDVAWAYATAESLGTTMAQVVESGCRAVDEAVACLVECSPSRHRHDYSATLLVGVLRPPWLVSANIGDGFLLARRAGGDPFLVARPQQSAETVGQTPTVLTPPGGRRAEILCLYAPDLEAVAMSSDGLVEVSLNRPKSTVLPTAPSDEFYGPLFDGLRDGTIRNEHAEGFLHASDSWAQREEDDPQAVRVEDDLTVVALARRGDGRGPS